MIVFNLSPFLRKVRDPLAVARQLPTDQTQPVDAAVCVCKDPANQTDVVIKALEPTAHGLFVRPLQGIHPYPVALWLVRLAQGHPAVVLEHRDKVLAMGADQIEGIFGRKPTVILLANFSKWERITENGVGA